MLNNPYALSFDGVDDYIGFTRSVLPVGAVSVAFHYQKNGFTSQITEEIVSTSFDSVLDDGLRIYFAPTRQTIRFGATGGPGSGWRFLFDCDAPNLVDGSTHWVLCEWDGTTAPNAVKMFFDDPSTPYITATSSGTIASHTYNLRIGKQANHDQGRFLQGSLDNISIWNKVLSEQERAATKNKYLKGDEQGLVALYRFDEGFSNVAYDHSGNGNHGIVYGASWVPGIVDLEWGYMDVTTIMPADVSSNSMTLKGNLRGLGDYQQAECYFQYTDDPNFETGIVETVHQVKTTPGKFEQLVTGLDNTKTYYYRAVATGISL